MKFSAQRELVRSVVVGNPNHLTADEVYTTVKQEMPNISLATVYRNLNFLANEGVIGKVTIPGCGDRFDGYTHPHGHLLCEKCGCIVDIDLEQMMSVDEEIQSQMKFTVRERHFLALGLCKDCI